MIGARVLLIEDNETNRFVAEELLLTAKCVVVSAQDGRAGVDYAIRQQFALILLDINLPILNGWDAAKEIRSSPNAKSKLTPIYALTGSNRPDQEQEMVNAEIQGILVKPLRAAQLQKILTELNTYSPNNTASAFEKAPSQNHDNSNIEYDVIMELKEVLGSALFKTQQQKFVSEITGGLEQLLAFSKHGSGQQTSQLAHRMNGLALVFGAKAIASKLEKIEVSANTIPHETLEQLIIELSLLVATYQRIIAEN